MMFFANHAEAQYVMEHPDCYTCHSLADAIALLDEAHAGGHVREDDYSETHRDLHLAMWTHERYGSTTDGSSLALANRVIRALVAAQDKRNGGPAP